MDIELSNSQKFSSSYQVVPGVLGARAAGMASTDRPFKDEEDLEGGPLVREHAASVEDSLRYRSRSSDYNGTGGGSPPLSASPAASGALPDDFLAINPVSLFGRARRSERVIFCTPYEFLCSLSVGSE